MTDVRTAVGAAAAPPGARVVGVVMNGVTGRMGLRQHLERSILAIRRDGGLQLGDQVVWPEPILVGRNEAKLRAIAAEHGLERWTTELDRALAEPDAEIYFDSRLTALRPEAVRVAIEAGKHVYCEKPLADGTGDALDLTRRARVAGVKNGVVQDKLYLPGLRKLARLREQGFFGRPLAARGEFGYWVFEEGRDGRLQRPSWNYRVEDGGGIVFDMFPHWSYVLDNLVAPVRAVRCEIATHVPERRDESGRRYEVTAEDAAYAIFELEGGAVAQINSSWAVRVHHDELFELQLDGTEGSAVAGLHRCRSQSRAETPWATWDPDMPDADDYRGGWREVHDEPEDARNGFRSQWEEFLVHVVADRPIGFGFLDGVRGVQLAESALMSAREGRRVAISPLEA